MSAEQPRRPAVPIPSDINAFNKKIIEEFRANGGKLSGPMAGRELMLLTTTGARSGEPRTVVLGFRPSGSSFVVIASANGAPRDPAWYRNLFANPDVTVEVGSRKLRMRARTTEGEEREAMARLIPYYEQEKRKTSRTIPVVVLEPISS
jgi:deazaflavin-dependent oxidoreductase (nitroreductase family)